jgi:hypothetical protein
VPYFEGFEGILNNNVLPNCSWTSSSPGSICRTYTSAQSQQRVARTGNKFGSFYYFPSGTNYFYTNGIQLTAGVTYSASVWYATNYYGDLNWSDLAIMVGPNQSTTGLVQIASSNGPAASAGYKAVASTFTVATSGVYYAAIRGTSSGGCCAYHLNWDDLLIEAPCSLNSPSLSLNTSTTTICEGDPVTITASGANTYVWGHGPTTAAVTENPTQSTLYTVVGTNTASGCVSTMNTYVNVLPKPNMFIIASTATVCSGKPVTISASGASTYTWSTGSNANFITANPTSAITYSVIGSNQAGCINQVSQAIAVNPLPAVGGFTDRTDICKGESATLTGTGAVNYQWASNSIYVQTAVAIVSPNTTTTYTLTGTNANGCTAVTTVVQNVQDCVGLQEITTTGSGVKVFPNPTGGLVNIEFTNGGVKSVEVLDITGRIILNVPVTAGNSQVDISNLSNGIYYVRIQTKDAVEVVKLNKN